MATANTTPLSKYQKKNSRRSVKELMALFTKLRMKRMENLLL